MMADIILTCPACGKTTAVSEHISEKTIACQDCGNVLSIPERKRTSTIRLKRKEKPTETAGSSKHTAVQNKVFEISSLGTRRSAFLDRERRRIKISSIIASLSWVVFALLTATLAFIRFYGGCQIVPLENLKQYGIILIGIGYLVIIFLALQDNMFSGLLCIMVPLYPFYYLFFVSGNVYMRAVLGALLVVFGVDFLMFLQAWFLVGYEKINFWIHNV